MERISVKPEECSFNCLCLLSLLERTDSIGLFLGIYLGSKYYIKYADQSVTQLPVNSCHDERIRT